MPDLKTILEEEWVCPQKATTEGLCEGCKGRIKTAVAKIEGMISEAEERGAKQFWEKLKPILADVNNGKITNYEEIDKRLAKANLGGKT